MTKYAFNKDGVLHDVAQTHPLILFAPEYAAQFIEVPFDAENGDEWDGVTLTKPDRTLKPTDVSIITMRQARLALHDAGLLASVSAAIDAMPEPDKTKAQIEWEYASEVNKNSAWVASLSAALGLNDEQLTELFNSAAAL